MAQLEGGIGLRLDYSDDDRSHEFWHVALYNIRDMFCEGVVFDDKNLFGQFEETTQAEGSGSEALTKALHLMPEIVTNDDKYTVVWSAIDEAKKAWDTSNEEEKEEHQMDIENHSVAGMVLVEDAHTHSQNDSADDNELAFQVLFDIYGNVVRSLRVSSFAIESVANWSVNPRWDISVLTDGEVGKEYQLGGKHEPPYI